MEEIQYLHGTTQCKNCPRIVFRLCARTKSYPDGLCHGLWIFVCHHAHDLHLTELFLFPPALLITLPLTQKCMILSRIICTFFSLVHLFNKSHSPLNALPPDMGSNVPERVAGCSVKVCLFSSLVQIFSSYSNIAVEKKVVLCEKK